ncbi:unnamed protein product [Clonostachys solani]|uniref:Uncharacterized protein n=1 Tax=Clonostachys solani TaxID=160281 RepID=A0A9N9YWR5_9HYPO|nr:unnamed protein product [Clonostachys solani]
MSCFSLSQSTQGPKFQSLGVCDRALGILRACDQTQLAAHGRLPQLLAGLIVGTATNQPTNPPGTTTNVQLPWGVGTPLQGSATEDSSGRQRLTMHAERG